MEGDQDQGDQPAAGQEGGATGEEGGATGEEGGATGEVGADQQMES